MSVRLRATAVAVVAATLTAGVVAALPATANAATATAHPAAATAIPAPSVKLTATPEYGGPQVILPGRNGGWPVIIKAVNTSDKAQTFGADFALQAKGAVNLRAGEVISQLTALGRTPATGSAALTGGRALSYAFFPKAHPLGRFTIPAHATYYWKAQFAATKAWPMNDNTMALTASVIQQGPLREATTAPLYVRVGKGNPGGTMDETLVGSALVTGYEKLTLTNHTGATLNQTWTMRPTVTSISQIETDVWVGSAAAGHWQPLNGGSIVVPAGLANGASVTYRIRLRLVHFVNKGLSHQTVVLTVGNPDGTTNPAAVTKTLTVLRGLA